MSIEAQQLTKAFGDKLAVVDLSFAVTPGEIYGLLGPNGAGKTTSLRMVTGLMLPTAGSASICGHGVHAEPAAARARIGFITGSTGLYERLTPAETLRYFGRLYGMARARVEQRIQELAELLHAQHRREAAGLPGADADSRPGGAGARRALRRARRGGQPVCRRRDPRGARAGAGDSLFHALHGGGGASV
jgi:ABC-type multidrug transport system ATPase subunit